MAVNKVLQKIREFTDLSPCEHERHANLTPFPLGLGLRFRFVQSDDCLPFRVRRSKTRSGTRRTRCSYGYPDLRLHSRFPVHAYDSSRLRAKVRLSLSFSLSLSPPSEPEIDLSFLSPLLPRSQVSAHASSLHRIQLSSFRNDPLSSRVVGWIGSCRVRNDAGD